MPNPGGIFQLDTSLISTNNCQPVQCGGTITANWWMEWGCSPSPSVVGGLGGCPEVARVLCPTGWTTITCRLTLAISNHPNDVWDIGWEIHDQYDQILGGRGLFGGPSNWQDKIQVGVGQTGVTSINYINFWNNDTSKAHWFVLMAAPTSPYVGALTGTVYAIASFDGICPTPPFLIPAKHSWAWWV